METAKKHTSSFLLSLLFALGAILLLVFAFFMTVSAFLPLINGENIQARGTIYGFVFLCEGFILILAAYFIFQKYRDQASAEFESHISLKGWHIFVLALATGLVFLIGYFIQERESVNWLILPVLTIPAVLLPIGLLFGFGAQQIQLGPRWRVWSIFGIGMTLSPLVLIFVEICILVVMVILVTVYLALQPEFRIEITALDQQLQFIQDDPEAILQLFAPYVLQPGVILSILAFFAVIVPIVEELVKPLGVWLFAGKLNSPAQGFAMGALSGAAYALVETLGSSAQTTEWTSLLSTRIGTSLLHITSTALMGYGIALAWQNRGYLKLFVMYLGSCTLHGIWNASVLLYAFSTIAKEMEQSNTLSRVAPFMAGISIALTILMLGILIFTNKKLNKSSAIAVSETPAPISE